MWSGKPIPILLNLKLDYKDFILKILITLFRFLNFRICVYFLSSKINVKNRVPGFEFYLNYNTKKINGM